MIATYESTDYENTAGELTASEHPAGEHRVGEHRVGEHQTGEHHARERSALVTGATGFLGGRLARELLRLGWKVTATGRNSAAGKQLQDEGITFIQADLCDRKAVEPACRGISTVFHCAAFSSPWGRYSAFYNSNVEGTANIIAGCKKREVSRLVYVSTPSIYFTGQDQMNLREDHPLPRRAVNAYAATKRVAEEAVAAAHEPDKGLATVTIRPRAIFGPGDTTILPRLIRANHSSGVPLFRQGNVQLDLTYIDNAVHALIAAAEAPLAATGQAYNITDGEPVLFREALETLFTLIQEPMHVRHIPFRLAKTIAAVLEGIATVRPGRPEPVMTRYTVSLLGLSQTFDITAARTKLGYNPPFSTRQGLELFAQWWLSHHKETGDNK